MFKRILIPTDGSSVARKAIKAGVALATEFDATIVAYHARESIEHRYSAESVGLIFMASHGRGKFASLLLGSVTQKVLAHSKIPVLVYR